MFLPKKILSTISTKIMFSSTTTNWTHLSFNPMSGIRWSNLERTRYLTAPNMLYWTRKLMFFTTYMPGSLFTLTSRHLLSRLLRCWCTKLKNFHNYFIYYNNRNTWTIRITVLMVHNWLYLLFSPPIWPLSRWLLKANFASLILKIVAVALKF